MFIMAIEPIQNMNASEVRAYFADKHTQKDLADAFAMTSNKFWWVEDNVYDYEAGSPEQQAALAVTDEWGALMDEYESRICGILTAEGVVIPKIGKIKVLEPFMKKHGYINGRGWWIKEQKDYTPMDSGPL